MILSNYTILMTLAFLHCWRRPKTDPLIGVVPIQN